VVLPLARRVISLVVEKPMSSPQGVPLDTFGEQRRLYAIVGFRRLAVAGNGRRSAIDLLDDRSSFDYLVGDGEANHA